MAMVMALGLGVGDGDADGEAVSEWDAADGNEGYGLGASDVPQCRAGDTGFRQESAWHCAAR